MKFCVIGLGRLGYQLATGLAEQGMEVMAIDSNEAIIASIRDHVTQAICMRITDEASLRSIGIEEIDTVIVAVGENFSQSILITVLLKKLKVKRIITRATSNIHKEILKLVGADEVILPERQVGIALADRLSTPFTDLSRVTDDFSVGQFATPQKFIGKTVADLDIYQKYNVKFIGIKKGDEIVTTARDYIITEDDKIILAGKNPDLDKITKL